MRFPKLIAPAIAAALAAGCATPTLLTSPGALAAFKPIPNSARAPCQMQRAVAEHNSRYDTMKTGSEVAYKAPCDTDKPAPKTS